MIPIDMDAYKSLIVGILLADELLSKRKCHFRGNGFILVPTYYAVLIHSSMLFAKELLDAHKLIKDRLRRNGLPDIISVNIGDGFARLLFLENVVKNFAESCF